MGGVFVLPCLATADLRGTLHGAMGKTTRLVSVSLNAPAVDNPPINLDCRVR